MSPSTSPKPSLDSEASNIPSEEQTAPTTPKLAGSRFRFGNSRTSKPGDDSRRKSIQFNIGGSDIQIPRRSTSSKGKDRTPLETVEKEHKPPSRVPSPPPPSTYERGVSFDTFDNRDAPDFSLTLNYKHKGYQCTRRSRTFLCGTDQNDYSDYALEWLIDELVDDGDEIVCLRVVEKDSTIASDAGIEAGRHRQEAERLFEQVIRKNSHDEKAISLVLELAIGKVQDIIQRMIRIYEPALLIVGTRGRKMNTMQSLLPGSVSKWCLQQSPIPVIVVRPSTKREKKKKKRLADPTRRGYNHILEMSERRGSRIFDASSSTDSNISRLPDEEAAVAAALGLPRGYTNSRSSLSTTVSERSSVSQDDQDPSHASWNSLDAVVMNSPSAVDKESPRASENESAEDDSTTISPPESKDSEEPSPGSGSPAESNASPAGEVSAEKAEEKTPDVSTEPSAEGEEPTKARMTIPVIITEDLSKDETKTED